MKLTSRPDVSERTLTRRDLNRALLARQLLLDRKPLPIPRAVEQIGALQTQYAPSAYVGLWTRVDGFERQALTEAFERRAVVQGTMMRNTIHVASPRDYWPLVLAIRPERMAWSRRIQKTESRELERAARRLRAFLSGCPRSQAEIVEKLGDEVWRPGIAIWLDLVRVPPSGRGEPRRAALFGLAEEWVGPEPELAHEQAVRHLVRRYLGAFGPAPRIAIADWAGMRVGRLERTLERMRLRRFRDERGRELLDLPRGALPDPETPAPPRDPARGAPAAHLQHEDAALVQHLPRRRRGRGHVALRQTTHRTRAVRANPARGAEGAGRGGGAASGVPRVSRRGSPRARRRRTAPTPCPCRRSPATRR